MRTKSADSLNFQELIAGCAWLLSVRVCVTITHIEKTIAILSVESICETEANKKLQCDFIRNCNSIGGAEEWQQQRSLYYC